MEFETSPIRAFGESKTNPPKGLRFSDVCFGLVFILAYFGLHLVVWNFTFPTPVELTLWRSASPMLIGLLVFYFICNGTFVMYPGGVAKVVFGKTAETIFELNSVAPTWTRYASNGLILFLYAVTRSYILLEGFIGPRSLPLRDYTSVDWSNFRPHI